MENLITNKNDTNAPNELEIELKKDGHNFRKNRRIFHFFFKLNIYLNHKNVSNNLNKT